MKKLAHKTVVAKWYAKQVMESSTIPYKEIEWLVCNLNKDAMEYIAHIYYENKEKI